MEKLYVKDIASEHKYIDKKKQKWNIYTENEMLDRYPYGNYRIVGDMRSWKKNEEDMILMDGNNKASIQTYKGRLAKNEMIIGYIPLEENDSYVRVVRKKHGKLIGMLIMLALIITIFLGGLYIGQMNRPIDAPVEIKSGEMTNPNPENIRLPGIERIYAKAGDTHVNQVLLNVEGNAYNLQYIITLKETGEEIYQSRIVQPGYGVREFNMNRSFEAGEYPILITVNSSAQEDEQSNSDTAYNAGQLEAILIVE